MFTLADLKRLLKENEELTWAELAKGFLKFDTRRVLDLGLHRSIVKDMIIEKLEAELAERRNLETRPFQDQKQAKKEVA